ncbi:MAG: alpha/beta hydrolase [Thermomicrobiales bacterium]
MILHRMMNLCVALMLVGILAGTGAVSATTPPPTAPDSDYFLYIPTNAATRGPLQVLVTVHGMGGSGSAFCQNLIARAEQNGWIIVSPTFNYQDYKNTDSVVQDDTHMLPRLKQIIDGLPAKTGLPIRDKVLLYGFSRGAQMVHRFAEFYPDRTLAVALFSAGSYTLPETTMDVNGAPTTLNFPFGVADIQKYTNAPFDAAAFRQVPFFLGVGGADSNADDAPRAWDPYIGTTRIARALSFEQTLTSLGLDSSLTVFPNVPHDVTNDMRGQAMAFLEREAFAATLVAQSRAVAQALLGEA